MRIAIDAHGGDHAPDAVVEGIRQAKEKWPDLKIILIGLKDMEDEFALDGVEFRPVTEKIEPEEKPTQAVRRKKDSSIVVGCQMVRKKEADAFISGGNTGALMAAGFFHVGRLKGVDRPALAPVFPTLNGKGILVLDVGANPEAKTGAFKAVCDDGKHLCQKGVGF